MSTTNWKFLSAGFNKIKENVQNCTVTTNQDDTLVDMMAKMTFHNRYTSIDIYGVDKSDYGHKCKSHECCGHYVQVGDVLYLKKSTQRFDAQRFDDVLKDCVRVYKVDNATGLASCHVG